MNPITCSEPLQASVVRIRTINHTYGMGYLVTPNTVITCAHVIAEATGRKKYQKDPPNELIKLDRPLSPWNEEKIQLRDAKVIGWYPACNYGEEPVSGLADLAILKICGSSYASTSPLARLAPGPQYNGLGFETYGCPKGAYEHLIHTSGSVGVHTANSPIQIQWNQSGYPIEHGYSGSPVWSGQANSVIGVITTVEQDASIHIAFMIPSTLLIVGLLDTCPHVWDDFFEDQRNCRNELVRGVEHLGTSKNNITRFLDNYLGTPERPVPFGGRVDILNSLDKWLDSGFPFRLMAAPAGRGKSAIVVHWLISLVQRRSQLNIIFLPISIRFATSSCSFALSTIAARLRLFFSSLTTPSPQSTEDLKNCILSVWDSLRNYPDRQFLLVLDGIDETVSNWIDQTLFPSDPPKNLQILLTARFTSDYPDHKAWLKQLGWDRECWDRDDNILMSLPLLSEEGLSNILASTGCPIDRLAEHEQIVEQLYRLSEWGDPLLVSLYIQTLFGESGEKVDTLTIRDISSLTPGYQGFFDYWYDDQKTLWKEKMGNEFPYNEMDSIFNLLATAFYPLTLYDIEELMRHLGFASKDIENLLRVASRLVIKDSTDNSFSFTHPKLTDYFIERELRDKNELDNYETVFINWGQDIVKQLNNGQLKCEDCPKYVLHSYVAHLNRSNKKTRYFLELLSEGWLKAWFVHEGIFNGFLNDVENILSQLHQDRNPLLIGEETRCFLCKASVRSFTNNLLPKPLLSLFIETGCWTIMEGLQFAYQYTDERKLELLTIIESKFTSEEQIKEAIRLVSTIEDVNDRVESLRIVVPYAKGNDSLLKEILAIIANTTRDSAKEKMLGLIAPYIAYSETHLTNAVYIVNEIKHQRFRIQALGRLTSFLNPSYGLFEKLYSALEAVSDERCLTDGIKNLTLTIKNNRDFLCRILCLVEKVQDEALRTEAIKVIALNIQDRQLDHLLVGAAKNISHKYYRDQITKTIENLKISNKNRFNQSDDKSQNLISTIDCEAKYDWKIRPSNKTINQHQIRCIRNIVYQQLINLKVIRDGEYLNNALDAVFLQFNEAPSFTDSQTEVSRQLNHIRSENDAPLLEKLEKVISQSDKCNGREGRESEVKQLTNDDSYLLERLLNIQKIPTNRRIDEFESYLGYVKGNWILIKKTMLAVDKLDNEDFRSDALSKLRIEKEAARIEFYNRSVLFRVLFKRFRKQKDIPTNIGLDDVKSYESQRKYRDGIWYKVRLIDSLIAIGKNVMGSHRKHIMMDALKIAEEVKIMRGTILTYINCLVLITGNLDGWYKKKVIRNILILVNELIKWPGSHHTYSDIAFFDTLLKVAEIIDQSGEKDLLLRRALELLETIPIKEIGPYRIKRLAEQGKYDQGILLRCLDLANSIKKKSYRVIPLSSLALLLDDINQYDRWAMIAKYMIRTERAELLFMLEQGAPVIKKVGGDWALLQTAKAIDSCNSWIH